MIRHLCLSLVPAGYLFAMLFILVGCTGSVTQWDQQRESEERQRDADRYASSLDDRVRALEERVKALEAK